MPETFTFEEAQAAPESFSFEEALGGETFSFEEALGQKPASALKRTGRSLLEAPIRIERGIGEKIGDVAAGGARAADIIREGDLLAGSPTAKTSILQRRRAFEQALSDPRYAPALMQAGDDPQRLKMVEKALGTEPRLEIMRQPEAQRAAEAAVDAKARQVRLEEERAVYQWGKEQAEWSRKVFKGSPDIDDTFISELAVAFGGTLPDIGLAAVPGAGPALASRTTRTVRRGVCGSGRPRGRLGTADWFRTALLAGGAHEPAGQSAAGEIR